MSQIEKPFRLDDIFVLLQTEQLEMHGLFEERSSPSATEYGSAPWNCRLIYRFVGSDGKTLWPMYCYGAGSTAGEAIISAVADARRLRSTPWVSKGAPAAPAAQLSLEDIGL